MIQAISQSMDYGKSIKPVSTEIRCAASETMILSPAALTGSYREKVDISNISSMTNQENTPERFAPLQDKPLPKSFDNYTLQDNKTGFQYTVKAGNNGALAMFSDDMDYASQKLLQERDVKIPTPSLGSKSNINSSEEFQLFNTFHKY